ncbi:uncharacterized protein [Drosophila takahashii]|uniref:uncharacterized protein n=1 Tax=Drosophila takahashii TaxID=29030 RepID=UPI001CF89396|nr:uncharacterized protein LOC108065837 [Drosophila takahashii]
MPLKSEDIHEKIKNGVYKLAVNDKSTRSTVWRVYRKIQKDDGSFLENVLYCIGCKGIMSFTHKSTTNLRRHRCHLQYLKKEAFYGYNSGSESTDRKEEPDASEEQEDQQSMSDDIEMKPNVADVAAFGGDSTLVPAPAKLPDISDIPLDVSGAEESNIYAQTWSLEYRKLTEDQKFYAKKAIDEILVLGRLRRLTLNTVPTAEQKN